MFEKLYVLEVKVMPLISIISLIVILHNKLNLIDSLTCRN